MSETNYTPIQLYRTTTASLSPSAGNLADGELGINLTDEKLYFKNAGGTVKLLAANLMPVANGGTGATTATAGKVGLQVITSSTGSEILPVGTTAQRDSSPAVGYIRYNTDYGSFEGYSSSWSSLGGVKSVDGQTYITAELTVGAGDDTLRFYTNSALRKPLSYNQKRTSVINMDCKSSKTNEVENCESAPCNSSNFGFRTMAESKHQ